MLLELSYLTGMHGMFFPAIDAHGGKYGNAILSKYSLMRHKRKYCLILRGTEKRCAAIVKIVLDDGTSVCVVGTHLGYGESF